tara:strand:+ start:232 stop:375 length:144 start_codon:yes stop_codon:yes gene_type:complete
MIVYRFKNLKTGVTYEDVMGTKDINRLIKNKNIKLIPLREVHHGKGK